MIEYDHSLPLHMDCNVLQFVRKNQENTAFLSIHGHKTTVFQEADSLFTGRDTAYMQSPHSSMPPSTANPAGFSEKA